MAVERIDYLNDDEFRQAQEEEYEEGQEQEQEQEEAPAMSFKSEGDSLLDAAEMLWICLANVSGGDWTKQSEEWQTAVKRWRDNYFNVIGRIKKGEGTPLTPEP